jgi:beta-galactosidase
MGHWSRREVLKSAIAVPAAPALVLPGEADAPPAQQPPSPSGPVVAGRRERLLLDFGWRFHLGHASDASKDFGFGGASGSFQKTGNFLAASQSAFDDSGWTPVDLPHDWAIGLPFTEDPQLASKGSYPLGRDYPATSVGWYRRVFELPATEAGRRVGIEFDGVYRDALVVLNGCYVGQHGGGYDPFAFDVTDFARPGTRNVLLVRVDATLSDGWFYEGAGIYRHAWLVKTSPVRVRQWGAFARATLNASGAATVAIRTEVENLEKDTRDVRVTSTVLDPNGRVAGTATTPLQAVPNRDERTFEQTVEIAQPALWSLEERNLYTLVTEVESGGVVTDRAETRFGVRSLRFDAQQGFFLNGRPVKVKGTCNHQDHAGVGVALPDAMQRHRVRKLQEMGCNALRTSHNPPTPELLDACDELGMLVLSETRMLSSNEQGLEQFESMIRCHRNHPSVFLWSMGNEEMVSATDTGLRILTTMKQAALKLDDSRPITIAPPPFGGLGRGGLAVCDVMGYNYADPQAEEFHASNPTVPVIGTENVSAVGTRGVYVTDKAKGVVSSYDPYTTTGRASARGWWQFVSARPWVAGGFVWTGFDYRGEPSPYGWPNISSQYGVIDLCGFPKDSFYYYQSWWTTTPVLHVFPHWNWPGLEGKDVAVWVYSNLERVELLHNGRSLGVKDVAKDQHLAWNVRYAPGVVEARGFRGGRLVSTVRRETTRAPAKLVVRADRTDLAADGEDVVVLAAEVQDAKGRLVPVTDTLVTFAVRGSGRLLGVGNGDPTSHESDLGPSRRAFGGLCAAIVQATKSPGRIDVEATSPGLEPATAAIEARSVTPRPQVPPWERPVPEGPGVTGLWRPEPPAAAGGAQDSAPLAAALGGQHDLVFSLRQDGGTLAGELDEVGDGFFNFNAGGPIEDGRVDQARISFRVGSKTYSGTATADRIELTVSAGLPFGGALGGAPRATAPAPRPAVGPPPDGTDPSIPMEMLAPLFAPKTLVLRRAKR